MFGFFSKLFGSFAKLFGSKSDSDLKKIIPITDEEEEAMNTGSKMLVFVTVEDMKKTIGDSDKRKINRELYDNEEIGYYLDINLFKQLTGLEPVQITKTKKDIELSFDLPKEMLNKDKNIKRTYYIIKLHDKKTERIEVEEKDGKIWFNTNEFSTYALTYVDEEISSTTNVVTTSNTINNPNTVDNITSSLIALILSMIAVTSSILYFKKN